ncbi:Tim44 domain-containing protein [Paucibacter sp. XJ19-41]|uniref:Tim44 domain-containing protein n=1 Tax=Paucibacter sp. XJ19-41 TaxID=2927824 RepID=UPI00234BFDCB|nr:Tim44-like domain-containing protein [Paucibacter sp. XJ19-41]MDC6166314.1 Tim44-like domain-containing protein [Paucibacter sp. XJ19-41]
MKSLALCTVIAALSLSLVAADVQAKRLGGGGMKRSVPTQPAKPATPPQNAPAQQQNAAPQQAAAPTAGATAGAAAAPKRSWMGPVAGLAAGLGLAALASHFGFGEALANIMTMVLLGLVVMVVIGFVMRRMAAKKAASQGLQFAGAGAPFGQAPAPLMPAPMAMPAGGSAPVAAAPVSDFDTSGFEQIAKRVFIRMQAANDAGDQNDLRRFTTPEMYASIQQELLDRKGTQRTDVLELQAQVVERVEERGEQIVSVRFSGLIREQSEAAAQPFDEVWHLVRPLDESREWAIAGIQAMA